MCRLLENVGSIPDLKVTKFSPPYNSIFVIKMHPSFTILTIWKKKTFQHFCFQWSQEYLSLYLWFLCLFISKESTIWYFTFWWTTQRAFELFHANLFVPSTNYDLDLIHLTYFLFPRFLSRYYFIVKHALGIHASHW